MRCMPRKDKRPQIDVTYCAPRGQTVRYLMHSLHLIAGKSMDQIRGVRARRIFMITVIQEVREHIYNQFSPQWSVDHKYSFSNTQAHLHILVLFQPLLNVIAISL